MDEADRQRAREDEKLLRRAEKALTEIKIASGLSEAQAGVLAALRIRLRGDPGKSLDDMMSAAGDLVGPDLGDLLAKGEKPKKSLDDLLSKPKPKQDWPS